MCVYVYRLLEGEPFARKRQVQDVLLCIAMRKKTHHKRTRYKVKHKGER